MRGTISTLACLLALPACYGGLDGNGGAQDSDGPDATDTADTEGGTEGDTDGDNSGDNDGPFACDPQGPAPSLPLRRLSKVQYANTVHDLVRWAAGDAGDTIFADVEVLVERMPADARRTIGSEVHGGFRRLDQNVHQEHVNGGYDVAVAVANRLVADHLAAIAGGCATDGNAGNDDACIDDFIRSFGERALRRPLQDDEVDFYREVFDADGVTDGTEPEAFADVIVVMMTSPQFMYMVEHGDGELEDEPGVYRLGPYELAQRLSYHLWQTAPDDALLEAARNGDLLTDEGYDAQVERMFADPRTAVALEEFFGEWLWLEDLPALDARIGTPVYDAFVGDLPLDEDSTQNMTDEVLDMASYYALDAGGSFEDFFTSDRSFATTADIAAIYGVNVWDGGEPPQFPDAARVGLISRAALVATGSPNTRPIMKGVFIRKALLCDAIPPPPDNANASPPDLSPDSTTREVVEGLTEQAGTACAGCHATLINPLGFATENFDSLGRIRSEQVLFDEDGNVTGTRPIDTTSVPRIIDGDNRESQGAGDLSQLLLESEKVQPCFARHYLRWTFGRPEDEDRDGCMLNGLTSDLAEGAPMGEVLRELALRDEFKTRSIEE